MKKKFIVRWIEEHKCEVEAEDTSDAWEQVVKSRDRGMTAAMADTGYCDTTEYMGDCKFEERED